MARNASGTYSREVNAYTDGAVIRADDHNTEHDDFGAEITDSLNRSGKGGMLAGLKLINGLVGTPAFYFAGATTTGMYLNTAGDLRLALTAADIQKWTAALVRIETALTVAGALTCTGALTAQSTAAITGDTTVGGTLGVTGNTTLSGTLTATSAATTLATLTVNGATTVNSTLGVTGNTTLGGTVAAWVASTAYVIGNQVIANGNIYTCDTNGTSAGSGTGPSGTSADIVDGTTRWDYVSAAPTLAVAGVATFRSQASFTFGADMTNDKIVNVGTPTTSTDAATKGYVDGRIGAVIAFAYVDEAAQGQTYYLSPGTDAATEDMYWIAPVAGVIDKLFVYHDTASATCSATYTVRKNAADQAVTCTVASGAQSGLDTTNSFSVAAGDRVTIKVVIGAGVTGPLDLSTALRFTPS